MESDAPRKDVDTDPVRALGHALRNTLSPAMLVAERLSDHADPAVQRSAKIILESLDKAAEAITAAVSK